MPESWQLLVHPGAIDDAREAREWYNKHSPSAANAFVAELDAAIDQILSGPHQWPPHVLNTRRYLFNRFPFFVVYRTVGNTIQIIAIQHASRRPAYWKDR